MTHIQLYRAQYIYPVSSPPITDGVIAISGERIAAVGPAAEVMSRYAGAEVIDLGAVLLMPQAVNAHTHLELTALAEMGRQHIADRSFSRWITGLVKTWRTIPGEVQVEGAHDGCQMLIESGTAALGDISNTHNSLEPLLESGLYGIIYHEVLSADPGQAMPLLQRAQEHIRRWRSEYGEQRIRFGVTLHTPFTVAPETFRAFLPWIIEEQVPLCVHAAESPAELEYFLLGTGEIIDVMFADLESFREWIPSPAFSPIRYLDELGILKTHPLLAHGVQVDRADLRLLAGHQAPVVHCPRSNFLLNCGRMPIELYQEMGAPLAMGTDSLSSSPSLNVWEEAVSALKMHLAAGIDLDPHAVLQMCTLDGARALGFADLLGSLEPGKLAKLAVGRPKMMDKDEDDPAPTAEAKLRRLWDGKVTMSSIEVHFRT